MVKRKYKVFEWVFIASMCLCIFYLNLEGVLVTEAYSDIWAKTNLTLIAFYRLEGLAMMV